MSSLDHESRLGRTLDGILGVCEAAGVGAAVIGGIATGALGKARFTKDIDLAVALDNDNLEDFLRVAQERRFEPRVADVVAFAKQARVLLLRDLSTGIEVDLALRGIPFHDELIDNAIRVPLLGRMVPVAAAQYIVVSKAITPRPQDHVDVTSVLEANPQIDIAWVRARLTEFAEVLEDPEIVPRFERLVRQARH
ncbi:MAG: nucleotidyltransferase [Dehalococcoidia bacterium]